MKPFSWPAQAQLSLWVLLTSFLCAGIFLVALHDVSMFDVVRYRLNRLCETANSEYRLGGRQRLSLVMAWMDQGLGLHPRLLDSSGRDLANGEDRSVWLVPGNQRWLPFSPRGPVIVRRFGSSVCVLAAASPPTSVSMRPALWVVPFLSILCCTVAAYVTLRLRRIEAAVNHFGSGLLGTRTIAQAGDPIGRLAKSFNQMANRIESLVDSHQRLCTDMSHELRSPLARLLLAVQFARRGTPGALDRIETEVSRVNDLVDELLDVVRAEVDPTTVCTEPIDLGSILTEITDRCDIEARERGCELTLRLSEPGSLMGDPELLRRAVENVLRNALQHSPSASAVELWAGGDADYAIVRIRDHGQGVPEFALQQIFRAFYRVELDRNRNSGGTGLGLAIAQRAIAVHHGTVSAENANPGLRVEIRLPRTQASGLTGATAWRKEQERKPWWTRWPRS